MSPVSGDRVQRDIVNVGQRILMHVTMARAHLAGGPSRTHGTGSAMLRRALTRQPTRHASGGPRRIIGYGFQCAQPPFQRSTDIRQAFGLNAADPMNMHGQHTILLNPIGRQSSVARASRALILSWKMRQWLGQPQPGCRFRWRHIAHILRVATTIDGHSGKRFARCTCKWRHLWQWRRQGAHQQ